MRLARSRHRQDRSGDGNRRLDGWEFRDPPRVIAFNTAEHWSEDVSDGIAREIQPRSDLAYDDVPSLLQAFVDRHAGRGKQLALRLV